MEPKKLYILSDGSEEYAREYMTEDEYNAAQERAIAATDGNITWYAEEWDGWDFGGGIDDPRY